jgi:cell wall-associated protease
MVMNKLHIAMTGGFLMNSKKLFLIFVVFIFVFNIFTLRIERAFASNSAITLPFDTSVSGEITDSTDEQTYEINLPKAGRITVDVSSYINEVGLELYDSEGNRVWDEKDIYTGSPSEPKKWQGWEDLEAGTYYIKIKKLYGYTGKYNLKVSYEAANNDQEPNDKMEDAQFLTLNGAGVTGFISWNDDLDYYKVVLPKAGRITVDVSSYISEVGLELYDSEGNRVWDEKDIYTGSPNEPKKWQGWGDLEAGTYYIKIKKLYGYTGKYILSVQCPDLLPSPPAVDLVSNKSNVVTGKTIANGIVYVKINSKVYTGKSDRKGFFRIPIPVQKEGTKLYVTVKNAFGYVSKERVVIVIDKIPPASPSVNVITSKSRTITGKAEANSTVVAYVGNKKIGSARSDKYGKYTIKITPKKAGTFIQLVVIDRAGNKSVAKVIKVK